MVSCTPYIAISTSNNIINNLYDDFTCAHSIAMPGGQCRCIKKSTRHNLGGNLFIGHRGCILLTPCVHRVGSYRQWVLGQPSCAMYCVHIPIPIATAKAWCCAFFTATNNLIHQHPSFELKIEFKFYFQEQFADINWLNMPYRSLI